MDEQTEIEAAVAAIKAVEMDVEEVERRVRRSAPRERRSRWAPDNAEGLHAYVVTTSEFAGSRKYDEIVYAESLKAAKAEHGWTQMRYTTKTVRRATPEDVAAEG
jgi:hypothetical protein